MPVILSDDTWLRIQKMLEDYESGVLRVIPGKSLAYEEQISAKSNCPGTKIGFNPDDLPASNTLTLDVCVDGSPQTHTFVIVS